MDFAGNLLYLSPIQDHSGRQKVDPTLQHYVIVPNNIAKYIHHVGSFSRSALHRQVWIDRGRKDARKGRQWVFFTTVNPMCENQVTYQNCDVTQPRVIPYKTKWMVYQNAVYCANLPVALKKGLTYYQTRSNAIILHDSVPADCIARVVNMKSKEILCESAYLSRRSPPKIVLKTGWQVRHEYHQHADETIRREDQKETQENRSDVNHGEIRSEVETEILLKVDYRIQGVPHAAVEQEDEARKNLISKLVNYVKNHPNKEKVFCSGLTLCVELYRVPRCRRHVWC